jgi:FKBP-type peptidyl-prolyl cis-trans isomerase
MKTRTLAVVAASLLALGACKEEKAAAPAAAGEKPAAAAPAAAPAAAASEFGTQTQKISYIMGMNIGSQFKANQVPLDEPSFVSGLKTSIDGSEPKMTKEQIQETMKAFQAEMQAKQAEMEKKQQAENEAAAAKNKQDGAVFLAENGKKPGVVTTASGLQYQILTEGKGPKPKESDTVTVDYVGTLIDGKEFDSSIKRGEPATFAVNAVIPGWIEALQLMPEGSKWKIFVPAELAYGAGGTGMDIGPNATLIFEVDLKKIEAPGAAPKSVEQIDGEAPTPDN